MKTRAIAFNTLVETVATLCDQAAHRLPSDVLDAVRAALANETHANAQHVLKLIVENAELADRQRIPLCQDTGVTVVFVEQGHRVVIEPPADSTDDFGLPDAIHAGVAQGYKNSYLRMSLVADPAGQRINTANNTPAVIHHRFVPGDQLKLTVMLKGGGCENKSQCKMLTPADGLPGVEKFILETVLHAGADACPPFVVGVGIGGNFEMASLLAKRALCRKVGTVHPEKTYADLEQRILARLNASGIGPVGLGGDTTALAVLVETLPCHIASLPVAVNIECHSHRHASATL